MRASLYLRRRIYAGGAAMPRCLPGGRPNREPGNDVNQPRASRRQRCGRTRRTGPRALWVNRRAAHEHRDRGDFGGRAVADLSGLDRPCVDRRFGHRRGVQADPVAAFQAATESRGNPGSWALAFTLASAAMGCLWGLLASTVFVSPNLVYTVFAAFVLGGVSAGAATHNSPYLPAYYGFTVPTALPMIVALLSRGAAMPIAMGLMVIGLPRRAHRCRPR